MRVGFQSAVCPTRTLVDPPLPEETISSLHSQEKTKLAKPRREQKNAYNRSPLATVASVTACKSSSDKTATRSIQNVRGTYGAPCHSKVRAPANVIGRYRRRALQHSPSSVWSPLRRLRPLPPRTARICPERSIRRRSTDRASVDESIAGRCIAPTRCPHPLGADFCRLLSYTLLATQLSNTAQYSTALFRLISTIYYHNKKEVPSSLSARIAQTSCLAP